MIRNTSDINIRNVKPLISPAILLDEYPVTSEVSNLVLNSRDLVSKIMNGEDDRLLAVVGPCSVHDTKASLEYAKKLRDLAEEVKDEIFIIMRVYFEKPRTTVGWKGLINDPYLDDSFRINDGLKIARKFLLEVNNLGLPCGSEFLDVVSPQFIADIISWGAIGARTTESQIHRELASGLSVPVGYKNGTGGSINIALDAIEASKKSHHFLSVTKQGLAAIVETNGNSDCHIILRGSSKGTNYDRDNVKEVCVALKNRGLSPYVMIDCSHGNSKKVFSNQLKVVDELSSQISNGEKGISAVMVESFLEEGNQSLNKVDSLKYGQSITDSCLGWDDTVKLINVLSDSVKKRRDCN